MSEALTQQLDLLPDYLSRHLLLTVTALAVGIGISLPLAVVVTRARALQAPVLMVASAIQTIPSLALLALMVPLLREIGFVPAVLALILYSMLPVIRNTVTGIQEVDPNLIEAGRGLGMTANQVLLKLQLPLAMPVIIAGIRTATVWVVGIATLSTPVGATSLGNYIFSGLQTQNYTAVLVGCVAAASLALVLDGLIRVMEIAALRRNRALIAIVSCAMLAVLVVGLSPIWLSAARTETQSSVVVVGTKTFTEQYILAQLIADRLQAAGFRAQTLESLGSTVAFDALIAGRIDCYVDYTGTIWSNYMKREETPAPEAVFDEVKTWLKEEHGIEHAVRLGFENTYALAMRRERAQAMSIHTIDELFELAPELRLGGDYEFFSRPEWSEIESKYGLNFRELVMMDSTLMYAAVATDEVDVITAFSTDGRIPAFDLTLLEDTRGAFPPYDALLLIGRHATAKMPKLVRVLEPLRDTIGGDAMRAANKHVDVDGGSVPEAAQLLRGYANQSDAIVVPENRTTN
ncbi:MAG: ABC transporter permease/substrate-binding protein [Gammaproteobacteria bacterium]|jgi:osmoprotectant transport system permease protein